MLDPELLKSPTVAPRRRILVVDDEVGVLAALKRTLRKENYDVEIDHDAKQALERLKKEKFDMVISDHLMPEMTGLEFMKLVRLRHPDAMRIMLTGHADMQTVIGAINQGEIYRFLVKPWDDVELRVTVSLAFEQQDLERDNRRLLTLVRYYRDIFQRLENSHPGITHVDRDERGVIVLGHT